MVKRQGLVIKKMTLKERVKITFLLLCITVGLTGAMIFFVNVSGNTVIDIFAGADTVYYSWRDVFVLLYIPVMGYFDVLFFLLLFVPLTSVLAQLWYKMIGIISGYIIVAFVLALPLSLYVSFFPLSDYYSCGLRGPLSGVYYVKNLTMCEQFEYHPEKEGSDTDSTSIIFEGKK